MKTSRRWILYSLLRVGIFAAVLALLVTLKVEPWLAAVIAAVVGLCVSYIFFRPQRDALARSVQEYRQSARRDLDSDAENDALDSREAAPAPKPAPAPAPAPEATQPASATAAQRGDGGLERESGGESHPKD